jgi:hypothetical protein
MNLKSVKEKIKGKRLVVVIGRDSETRDAVAAAVRSRGFDITRNPENSRHPWDQVEWVEQVCDVLNTTGHHDYCKLIVTNSSYVIDHLCNLMVPYRESNESKLRLKRKSSFMNKKDVAVFECEDGKIRSILGRDGHIDWDSLSKPAKWLSSVYFDLLGDD